MLREFSSVAVYLSQEVTKLSWCSSTKLLIHIADYPCHGTNYHKNSIPDALPGGDPSGLQEQPQNMDWRPAAKGRHAWAIMSLHGSSAQALVVLELPEFSPRQQEVSISISISTSMKQVNPLAVLWQAQHLTYHDYVISCAHAIAAQC